MANEPDEKPKPAAAFKLKRTLTGHKRAVSSLKFSPVKHDLLASASADTSIELWNVNDGTRISPAQPMAHSQGINDIAWNPEGKYLASVSDDLTVRLWDAQTGTCLRTLTGHTHYVYCCQFDPPGHILATGSFDETIRFWDVRSGRCLREIPAHSDPVSCLDFNLDGTMLVSGSYDGLVRIWDTHNGHCLKTLSSERDGPPVSSVKFTPNGRYLLLSTLDSKARLVDFEAGKVAKTYLGHSSKEFTTPMAFVTPVGPYVVAASEDGGLVVWDVNSRQVVQHIQGRKAGQEEGDGHWAPVLALDSHMKLPLMATGANEPDNSIKLWSYEE